MEVHETRSTNFSFPAATHLVNSKRRPERMAVIVATVSITTQCRNECGRVSPDLIARQSEADVCMPHWFDRCQIGSSQSCYPCAISQFRWHCTITSSSTVVVAKDSSDSLLLVCIDQTKRTGARFPDRDAVESTGNIHKQKQLLITTTGSLPLPTSWIVTITYLMEW